MITLKKINRDNYQDVINLSVTDKQKEYVASNIFSLAQAKAQPECTPMAIYNDDILVGFVMYCLDYEDKEYWIYRIMIDQKYQKMGYGREALQNVISMLSRNKERNKIYLNFEPENAVAEKLYTQLGFVHDGRIIHDEIVYCLHY